MMHLFALTAAYASSASIVDRQICQDIHTDTRLKSESIFAEQDMTTALERAPQITSSRRPYMRGVK